MQQAAPMTEYFKKNPNSTEKSRKLIKKRELAESTFNSRGKSAELYFNTKKKRQMC